MKIGKGAFWQIFTKVQDYYLCKQNLTKLTLNGPSGKLPNGFLKMVLLDKHTLILIT